MSDGKRYNITGMWDYEENPSGSWVDADDYAALEAERDELRAQVEAMRVAVQGYLIACDEGEHEYQVKIARHNMRQVIAALQAKP